MSCRRLFNTNTKARRLILRWKYTTVASLCSELIARASIRWTWHAHVIQNDFLLIFFPMNSHAPYTTINVIAIVFFLNFILFFFSRKLQNNWCSIWKTTDNVRSMFDCCYHFRLLFRQPGTSVTDPDYGEPSAATGNDRRVDTTKHEISATVSECCVTLVYTGFMSPPRSL